MIVDRREAYYSRAAASIAADPLDFYARAERGRRIQAALRWNSKQVQAPNVVPIRRRKSTP